MARNLPWAQESKTEVNKSRGGRAARAVKQGEGSRLAISGSSNPQKSSPAAPSKTLSKKRYSSRTPSTSPPPGPPEVEPMIDGFDGDDIYIMVEDEFQEVAQSFTAHLHHAEYQRLKKKAKASPRKILAEPTSAMRTELKHQIRSSVLKDKQRNTIKGVIPSNDGLGPDEEESSDDSIEDPWSGTALGGLMKNQNSQKTSLVGLEKLRSGTRAGRGFERHSDEVLDGMDVLQGEDKYGGKDFLDQDYGSSPQASDDGLTEIKFKPKTDINPVTTTSAKATWKAQSKSKAFNALLDNDSISMVDSADDDRHLFRSVNQRHDVNMLAKSKSDSLPNNSRRPNKEEEERKARLEEVPRFIF